MVHNVWLGVRARVSLMRVLDRVRFRARVLFALVMLASGARPAVAQWSTTHDQFYRQASHNWQFRRNFPAADRLFNAFDYGHAILYETLWTAPTAPVARLEEKEYDFITRRLLVNPPRIPLEESAIEVEYAKLVPEAKQMFDWAHVLHRQVYDVWADERIPVERKDAAVQELVRYYRSRPDVAFSSHPKHMDLMEGQPYSLAFRRRYPKFNGLIWAYHWMQVGLYEPLVTARTRDERQRGVASTLERFRQLLVNPPASMPRVMPMTAAIAPEFSRRYPEVAIIFDNLHSMHDVISDILADTTVPRAQKRAEILSAARRYRDDTSFVTTVAEWRSMAASMGAAQMGGSAVGLTPSPATGTPAAPADPGHVGHVGHSATPLWSSDTVEKRIREAGITARPLPASGPHMFMSIPAKSYELPGGDELQLFVYADSAARAADTEKLDIARVAPPGMMIKWRAQPTMIIDGNLAAIVITNDEARRKLVLGALSPLGDGR
jgi:hypothetical protein